MGSAMEAARRKAAARQNDPKLAARDAKIGRVTDRAMAVASYFVMVFVGIVIAKYAIWVFGGISITIGVIATILAEIVVILMALYITKKNTQWRSYLMLGNFKWRNMLIGAGTGIGLYALNIAASLVMALSGVKVFSSETSTALTALGGFERFAILMIVVPFVVPFIEEVFFRGMVLNLVARSFDEAKRRRGAVWGIAVSSLLFIFAHLQGFETASDWFVIGSIAMTGTVSGILAWRTQSVFTSYAAHLAYNLTTVIMASLR